MGEAYLGKHGIPLQPWFDSAWVQDHWSEWDQVKIQTDLAQGKVSLQHSSISVSKMYVSILHFGTLHVEQFLFLASPGMQVSVSD